MKVSDHRCPTCPECSSTHLSHASLNMPYLYILKIFQPESKLCTEALQACGEAIAAGGFPKAYPLIQHCRTKRLKNLSLIHGSLHFSIREYQHKL